MGLKCRVPRCRTEIYALTGLAELLKLSAHIRRAHGVQLNVDEALDLRAQWENAVIPDMPLYDLVCKADAQNKQARAVRRLQIRRIRKDAEPLDDVVRTVEPALKTRRHIEGST